MEAVTIQYGTLAPSLPVRQSIQVEATFLK